MDLTEKKGLEISHFKARRDKVFAQMEDNSALIVFTETEKRRNNDCEYLFRPDSYFWYLTGFNEPQSALLLIKKNGKNKSVLFLRKKDPLMETWNGRRLGIDAAPSTLDIDKAYDIEHIGLVFPDETAEINTCYYAKGIQEWGDEIVAKVFEESVSWYDIISEMRLKKDEAEVEMMQKSCFIASMAHIRAMKETRPNRTETEIEGEIQYEYSRHGSRFAAYNSIVAGGNNACILHYSENDQILNDGDLLLIDAGCEFDYYAADITRTFPVNGKFTQAQKEIYNIVLKVQKEIIEMVRPGVSMMELNNYYVKEMMKGLVELGVFKGDVDKLIEEKAYLQVYMHGLGHSLGLDVHDVGNIGRNGNRERPLEAGMVFTIEPGIYISENLDVPEQYKGIGVRIEDNILVTENGHKDLTSCCPKEIEDIESLMAQK